MFGFERLVVWNKAIEFADRVYETTRSFPNEERFGLATQLQRAAVSISSNIAEGNACHSKKDFSRFIEIAYGSLMECVSQVMIAKWQMYIHDDQFRFLYSSAEELAQMLSGLRRSLRRNDDEKS